MLSEQQRNIVVELTLSGRISQYITDKLDCLISTIRRIRKNIGKLLDDKKCQGVAEIHTGNRYTPWTSSFQTNCLGKAPPSQVIYNRIAVQKKNGH